MALIKSNEDIKLLRIAGQKLALVLDAAKSYCAAGISLEELDRFIHAAILEQEAKPSFLGYDGFPNSSCLSLNEQVVHGIPDSRVLKEGDILGIDVGIWYRNVCVDAAITCPIGKVPKEIQDLLIHTQEALQAGIRAVRPFRRVGVISSAIQAIAEQYGYGIVRVLTGHGVGHAVHELPEVPNFGQISDGALLKPGMVLAIEPMFNLGQGDVVTQSDGWGVVTADGSYSVHFEHTVVVTKNGAEILTKTKEFLPIANLT